VGGSFGEANWQDDGDDDKEQAEIRGEILRSTYTTALFLKNLYKLMMPFIYVKSMLWANFLNS
jgi:hypothetical protein